MLLLKSSFPVFNGKISLALISLLFFSSIVSAQVKSGIYKVDYRTDSAFINAYFKPYDQQNTNPDLNISTFYNYQYKPLLDSTTGVRYIVVISKNDPNNKEYYPIQMVWLNKHSPDNFHITYSDSLVRKFVGMELYIGKQRNYWNPVRPYFNNGFIWNQAFDNYSSDDGYRYKLSDSNFYSGKNLFILKSKKFELVSDSVKVDSNTYYSYPLGDFGYRTAKKYLSYKQAFSAFKLKEAKAYQSFLYLPVDVKFHTGTIGSDHFKNLHAGDFIAITKETDEWYWGEHISIDGQVTSGRIYIDDLWIGQRKLQIINGLQFRIKHSSYPEDQSFPNALGPILGIKIYKDKKLIQVIKEPGLVNDTTQIIHPIDVNFDGYPDLQFYSHSGGAGPNYGNNYYLYNPKTKQFDYHQKLSDLSQPTVDVKSKTISAAWRNGAGNWGSEKYKWINHKLTLVEYYEIRYLDDDRIAETHDKMIKGKMRKSTRVVREEELNSPF